MYLILKIILALQQGGKLISTNMKQQVISMSDQELII